MRVQFSVSKEQWEQLELKAQNEGYPDVPSYCKDLVLEDRTYGNLWKIVVEKISKMESTDPPFALRDLIDTPPASLGVKLYNNRELLGIEVLSKKDALKTNLFRKK